MASPRFVAYARGPRYGSRDEFVGWGPWRVALVAETLGWLNYRLNRLPDYYDELNWDIIDNEPWRDAAKWGPRLPYGYTELMWAADRAAMEDPDYLPF